MRAPSAANTLGAHPTPSSKAPAAAGLAPGCSDAPAWRSRAGPAGACRSSPWPPSAAPGRRSAGSAPSGRALARRRSRSADRKPPARGRPKPRLDPAVTSSSAEGRAELGSTGRRSSTMSSPPAGGAGSRSPPACGAACPPMPAPPPEVAVPLLSGAVAAASSDARPGASGRAAPSRRAAHPASRRSRLEHRPRHLAPPSRGGAVAGGPLRGMASSAQELSPSSTTLPAARPPPEDAAEGPGLGAFPCVAGPACSLAADSLSLAGPRSSPNVLVASNAAITAASSE
mmetsp:Transcript_11159/g.43053  ORF Transcript_11159/g.43053 Transcript_11159/m.43053 type:complete len:286 (+) Transcript_11159:607-1464(+)